MDNKKNHEHCKEITTEEERKEEQEHYLNQWKLVQETEDMDDECIVKEYEKILSKEPSNSDNKKNK